MILLPMLVIIIGTTYWVVIGRPYSKPLQVSTNLLSQQDLLGKYYYFSHFTNEKTNVVKWHCKNSNKESVLSDKICTGPWIQ